MPRQRAIRFPDDLHDAIEAEVQRLGHPHTFSSVIINGMRGYLDSPRWNDARPPGSPVEAWENEHARTLITRGSPSPSLERAKRSIT